MLEFLGSGASERKLRRFACACGRQPGDVLPEPALRGVGEVAERFADGEAAAAEVGLPSHASRRVQRSLTSPLGRKDIRATG
jgi:hypothetical protein